MRWRWPKRASFISVAAQRKSDSLQDRIDALEREKEDVEQSVEEAVLQVFCCKHVHVRKNNKQILTIATYF